MKIEEVKELAQRLIDELNFGVSPDHEGFSSYPELYLMRVSNIIDQRKHLISMINDPKSKPELCGIPFTLAIDENELIYIKEIHYQEK